MADPEQIAILEKGVAEWNAWRGDGQYTVINLRNAKLSKADLRDADLRHANLEGANLRAADLSGAELRDADLRDADLRHANLEGANLRAANLRGANLDHAELRNADLRGATVSFEWGDMRAPSLRIADLRNADLRNATLERADLSGANLTHANLVEAILRDTKLRGAILHGANLRAADLRDANLNRAKLNGADLSDAILDGAILDGAYLDGANLSHARLSGTFLGNVDLTSVIGLETCNYQGPSTIDYQTLEKSKSKPLPLSFLRGIGLPDKFIEYLPSLLNQAIQHYSCFISYSAKDQEFAERLHADLQNRGVRCWFAPHDLRIGKKILDEIDAAIRLRDRVLLILSEHAINSDWVEDEVTAGFEEERKRGEEVLFPVCLDEMVLNTKEAWASKLRARLIGDFTRWKDHDAYKQSFDRVVRDLTVPPQPPQKRKIP